LSNIESQKSNFSFDPPPSLEKTNDDINKTKSFHLDDVYKPPKNVNRFLQEIKNGRLYNPISGKYVNSNYRSRDMPEIIEYTRKKTLEFMNMKDAGEYNIN
jgi:hypothetical protein